VQVPSNPPMKVSCRRSGEDAAGVRVASVSSAASVGRDGRHSRQNFALGAEMTTARARARWVGRRPHISGSIIDWGWRRRVYLSRAAIPEQNVVAAVLGLGLRDRDSGVRP